MKTNQKATTGLTDKTLIERFLAGDNAAFDQLVLRYRKRVYAQVYQMVPHREDALDLTQEVFLKVFQGLSHFNQRSNFYTWLYRITVNCCIDFLRSRQRKPADLQGLYLEHDPPASISSSPLHQIEAAELFQQIRTAVMDPAPKQREIFMLRHWEHLRITDIARYVGRSEGTVKAQLCHAHRKLRDRLRPYIEQGEPTQTRRSKQSPCCDSFISAYAGNLISEPQPLSS